MGLVGAAFEFGVVLHAHKEGPVGQLHGLHQLSIRRQAAQGEPGGGQRLPIGVVELIAVAVPLHDLPSTVAALHRRAPPDHAGVGPQTQGAALVDVLTLAGHEVDHLVLALFVKLPGVGVRDTRHVPGKFDDRDLHPQADAEIMELMLSGVLRRKNHPRNPPAAKAARHKNAVQPGEQRGHVFRSDFLRVDPADVDVDLVGKPGVAQRLRDGEIGVVQGDVFPHKADLHTVGAGAVHPFHQLRPLCQVRVGDLQAQLPADHRGKVGALQHQRGFIKIGQGEVFNHAVGLDVAEQGNLLENRVLQRLVTAEDDEIRVNAHALEFLDRMLRRLGLVFLRAVQPGHQRDVEE